MREEYKVYHSVNEKKGIISVSFTNPVTMNKTTKSLGKNIGIDQEKANVIISQIFEIINDASYCSDFGGYLKVRDSGKFDKLAIDCIFKNSDLIKKFNDEFRRKSIERLIPIKSEDGKEFVAPAIQLLGTPGSGKTKTIQQLIGSIEQNTPASTTSNTTFGSFEAYVIKDCHSLNFAAMITPQEYVQEYLFDNIRLVMIEFLLMPEEERKSAYESMYDKLMSSPDMKLRLYILSGREMQSEYEKILNAIEITAKKLWDKCYTEEHLSNNDYLYSSLDEREKFKLMLRENNEAIDEIEIISKDLMKIVQQDLHRALKDILKYMDDLLSDGKRAIKLEIATDDRTYGGDDIYTDKKPIQIRINSDSWVKYIYFEFACLDDQKSPDVVLKKDFFRVLKLISCADEQQAKANLFPLISNLRIKGNFSPLWKPQWSGTYIILDSEGVGHDTERLDFNVDLEENVLMADKILWIINSTKDMNAQEKYILERISLNGCLPITTLCFNRLEQMDKASETSDHAKNARINMLLDNLFKHYENKTIENGIDYTFFKGELKKRMLQFEHLERVIESESLLPLDILNLLKTLDIKTAANIESCSQKLDVTKTIESFENIFDFNTKTKDVNEDLKPPLYSWIKLSRNCDFVAHEFVQRFNVKVKESHWATVKAFNVRLVQDWNHRGWDRLTPESDLKYYIKDIVMNFFMNPTNYGESDKSKIVIWCQSVQNEISKSLVKPVEEIIVKRYYTQWCDALNQSGIGSGNMRKENIQNIIASALALTQDGKDDNIVFRKLEKIFNQLDILRDKSVKFEL